MESEMLPAGWEALIGVLLAPGELYDAATARAMLCRKGPVDPCIMARLATRHIACLAYCCDRASLLKHPDAGLAAGAERHRARVAFEEELRLACMRLWVSCEVRTDSAWSADHTQAALAAQLALRLVTIVTSESCTLSPPLEDAVCMCVALIDVHITLFTLAQLPPAVSRRKFALLLLALVRRSSTTTRCRLTASALSIVEVGTPAQTALLTRSAGMSATVWLLELARAPSICSHAVALGSALVAASGGAAADTSRPVREFAVTVRGALANMQPDAHALARPLIMRVLGLLASAGPYTCLQLVPVTTQVMFSLPDDTVTELLPTYCAALERPYVAQMAALLSKATKRAVIRHVACDSACAQQPWDSLLAIEERKGARVACCWNPFCPVPRTKSLHVCARCGVARYCSAECQRSAWIDMHHASCAGILMPGGP